MAATVATASSLLARRLLLTRLFLSSPLRPFSTADSSSSSSDDSRAGSNAGPDPEQQQPPEDQDLQAPARPRARDTRPLENGLDPGIYKAIIVGKVGQEPIQKRLRSGRTVVLFSLGTGGIRNNRRPLDREEPHQYAERSSVQWHRVCIYPDRLGSLALKHVKTG
ncbi:hypothetical protein E2562_029974 [Oryza meyeriana var. granulata]|uniref:Single-stranded DNA-binding protein n=1 Tax=Oryza meyeriana var. granulata TaxID=110450 RepID=A0A6G1CUY2_9ORYZ|nr:hypothetical protein E2562_029974 [Oryza meyeriana var. granulata]